MIFDQNPEDELFPLCREMDVAVIARVPFDEGTLNVVLKGACSGCPSSSVTLKAGIQALFEKMLPEVKQVVAEEA